MPTFIPGLELSRRYFHAVVQPILDNTFPDLPYAAALIGPGSDVLGYDTEMSTDHDWGPRVRIFLSERDASVSDRLQEAMKRELPDSFLGYALRDVTRTPRVAAGTLRAFVQQLLAYDLHQPIDAADWLTFPSQKLLEITAGSVFWDGVGELTEVRRRLAYYPRDVWLYLLAAGWQRIGQEEHLMPRAGSVGDELGASLIGARLVRDVMSLCFLMERTYAPYPKWFGSAFGRLRCATDLQSILGTSQRAETWPEREAALAQAYVYLARMHNALRLTDPLLPNAVPFHTRPFQVIGGERFADAIKAQIRSPEIQRIASRRLIGSVDQFSDSTDLRGWPQWRPILRALYE